MTLPKLTLSNKSPSISKASAYVVGVADKAGKPVLAESLIDTAPLQLIDLTAIGAGSKKETTAKVFATDGSIYLLVGLGDGELNSNLLRDVAGAAVRALGDFKDVVVGLPTASPAEALAIAEGSLIASYEFVDYKGSKKPKALSSITILTHHKVAPVAVADTTAMIESMHALRDLVNMPPNDLFPQSMAASFVKVSKIAGVTIEVWDEKRLAAEKMVGVLNVGKGSTRPPRLVKIEYKPKAHKKHLALVGKGITFDSGGLTLKPGLGMLGMKYDMTGAATVGHAILAIAKMKLAVKVTAYLCIAENLPSGSAMRPNDVLTYRNGKTVEVTNTDAEGRLVLADGLILASEQKPDLIVDVATLTGAARVALGTRYTGLFANAGALDILQDSAKQAGELVWHMPLAEELRALLNSETADMINSKLGDPTGGMIVGAHFLNEFVGSIDKAGKQQIPWAHLDIAGPASNDGAAYGYLGKGATGVIFRTLIETARALV